MNPFHYGTPVDAEHFAGRQEELKALGARMRDGINVVLVSPRRYGKTSLLLLAESEMSGRSAAIVHVNVLRCRDAADLAAKLASRTYRLPSARWHRAKHAAADFARRLQVAPTVTFGADGTPRFGFGGDMATEAAETVIADVYGILAGEAPRRAPVLILDEFQAISDYGEHLPGVIKALADEHHRVSLVLAGSSAHLMERLTGSTGSPLYGMAERIALGPVRAPDMTDYLLRRAAIGSKAMKANVADKVVDRAGPVPNDIQRLAYAAFEVAGAEVTTADVEEGMAQSVAHDAAPYADAYQRLSIGQRRVLVEIAQGADEQLYSARFARSAGLATGASVRRAIDALSAHELIVHRSGTWVVADPFFARWLAELIGG